MNPLGAALRHDAGRVAGDGVTRRNGDVLVPADEINALATIWQFLGVSPADQAARTEKQSFLYKQDKAFMERTTLLKNNYIKALKAGEGASEVREDWARLQAARERSGLTRQPMSALLHYLPP